MGLVYRRYFMNASIKEKLSGKSAYIALTVLLVSILVFTVIAIIATVNSSEDEPLTDGTAPAPEVFLENSEPSEESGAAPEPSPAPEQTESVIPEQKPVYAAPVDGGVQKDYASDVLVFSQTMNDHRVHLGIDISGKIGDPVKAFGVGTVERIFSDPFMGKTVVIDHGNGLKSMYMNLADTIPDGIAVGSRVEVGTVIGAIGESAITECADAPHVHVEVVLDGRRIDPRNYVTLPSASLDDEEYEG